MTQEPICVFCARAPKDGLFYPIPKVGDMPICEQCLKREQDRKAQRDAPIPEPQFSFVGHCKNCKSWHSPGYDTYGRIVEGRGRCNKLSNDLSHEVTVSVPNPKANDDVDDMGTIVLTRPDFGCVLFEAKGVV